MRLILLLALPSFLFLHISCKKYSPAAEAFFIRPGKITVATQNGQGSGSHKITDLWLYVNGKFQGAYPVENLMPIVTKGKQSKINILAGIKKNGIADTRIFSNFYSLLEFDTLVENGKTIERPFTFTYSGAVTFTWTEDFDGQGYTLQKSGLYSDTTFVIAPPSECFEGKSAVLGLSAPTPTGSIAQVESLNSFELPKNSPDVFLELNYKCNHAFIVGMTDDAGVMKPVMTVNPQENWNKIYIQLSDAIAAQPSFRYKIYFALFKEADGTSPTLYLDNIKLLYIP